MGRQPSKTPQTRKSIHQRAFLSAFEDSGCIGYAAKAAKITREAHYKWLRNDAAYAEAFDLGKRIAGDNLEDTAMERAKKGVNVPIYFRGRVCGHVKRYSDSLMMFLLRGLMPEKYGSQHRQQVSAPLPPIQPNVQLTFVYPDGSTKTG